MDIDHPSRRRSPLESRERLLHSVTIEMVVNGLSVSADFKLTTRMLADLEEITDPQAATEFLRNQLRDAVMTFADSYSTVRDDVMKEAYKGNPPGYMNPPLGTEPRVTSRDMEKFFALYGFSMVEPEGFTYTRVGNNSNGSENISFKLTLAKTDVRPTVAADFGRMEGHEALSPELIENAQIQNEDTEAKNLEIYKQAMADALQAIDTKAVLAVLPYAVEKLRKQHPKAFTKGENLERLLADFDVAALKKDLEPKISRRQKEAKGSRFDDARIAKTRGAAFVREGIESALVGALEERFIKQTQESPDFEKLRNSAKEKLGRLAIELRRLADPNTPFEEKIAAFAGINDELKEPGMTEREKLTLEKAQRAGTIGYLLTYLIKIRGKAEFPEEGLYAELKQRTYELSLLFQGQTGRSVIGDRINEVAEERFGRRLDFRSSWNLNYTVGKMKEDPSLSRADVSLLEHMVKDYESAPDVPVDVMVHVKALYGQMQAAEAQKDKQGADRVMNEIIELLQPYGPRFDITFFPDRDLTVPQRNRVRSACERIAAALKGTKRTRIGIVGLVEKKYNETRQKEPYYGYEKMAEEVEEYLKA